MAAHHVCRRSAGRRYLSVRADRRSVLALRELCRGGAYVYAYAPKGLESYGWSADTGRSKTAKPESCSVSCTTVTIEPAASGGTVGRAPEQAIEAFAVGLERTIWIEQKRCFETTGPSHVLVWLWMDEAHKRVLVITCVPRGSEPRG